MTDKENPSEVTKEDEVQAQDPSDDPQQLQGLLEDARNKADEHWNQLLRLQAEMENLRKRSKRDLENAHKYALEKFALELLPVRDSMEMGMQAVQGDNVDPAKIQEGMELTLKMMTDVLGKFAIREVDPQGEKFNPDLHQAMSMQESDQAEPNTVLTVVQKGYTLNERLIRPALVIVAKAPAGTAPSSGYDQGGSDKGSKVDEQA